MVRGGQRRPPRTTQVSGGGASRCPLFEEPVEPPKEGQADHHDQQRDDRRVGPIVLGHDAGGCLPLRLVDAIVVPVIAGVERNRANARRPLRPVNIRITVHSEGDEVHLDRHQDTGRDCDDLVQVTLHCSSLRVGSHLSRFIETLTE